jgi:hypothetical protein
MSNEFVDQSREEVNRMQKQYEAPELTLIGEADEVILGIGGFSGDFGMEGAVDFELEQD